MRLILIDIQCSDTLYGTLGLIIVLVLVTRSLQVTIAHIRLVSTLNLNIEQQRHWTQVGSFWSKVKKNLLVAPLIRRRHNKEFQLSTAVSMETLPSRLHTIFLLFYLLSNLLYCCLLDRLLAPAASSSACRGERSCWSPGCHEYVAIVPVFRKK